MSGLFYIGECQISTKPLTGESASTPPLNLNTGKINLDELFKIPSEGETTGIKFNKVENLFKTDKIMGCTNKDGIGKIISDKMEILEETIEGDHLLDRTTEPPYSAQYYGFKEGIPIYNIYNDDEDGDKSKYRITKGDFIAKGQFGQIYKRKIIFGEKNYSSPEIVTKEIISNFGEAKAESNEDELNLKLEIQDEIFINEKIKASKLKNDNIVKYYGAGRLDILKFNHSCMDLNEKINKFFKEKIELSKKKLIRGKLDEILDAHGNLVEVTEKKLRENRTNLIEHIIELKANAASGEYSHITDFPYIMDIIYTNITQRKYIIIKDTKNNVVIKNILKKKKLKKPKDYTKLETSIDTNQNEIYLFLGREDLNKIFNFIYYKPEYYMINELLSGITLNKQIYRDLVTYLNYEFNPSNKIEYPINKYKLLKDISNGLIFLHNMEICHFDLAARNIFISGNKDDINNCTFKIGDFGKSKLIKQGEPILKYRQKFPRNIYHPETGKFLGKNCDIFSLGLIFLSLIVKPTPSSLFIQFDKLKQLKKKKKKDTPLYKRILFLCGNINSEDIGNKDIKIIEEQKDIDILNHSFKEKYSNYKGYELAAIQTILNPPEGYEPADIQMILNTHKEGDLKANPHKVHNTVGLVMRQLPNRRFAVIDKKTGKQVQDIEYHQQKMRAAATASLLGGFKTKKNIKQKKLRNKKNLRNKLKSKKKLRNKKTSKNKLRSKKNKKNKKNLRKKKTKSKKY